MGAKSVGLDKIMALITIHSVTMAECLFPLMEKIILLHQIVSEDYTVSTFTLLAPRITQILILVLHSACLTYQVYTCANPI